MSKTRVVHSAGELVEAVESDVMEIVVQGAIAGMPMITLRPGVTLRNGTLTFGAKGVRLTWDNTLDGVTVLTAEDEVAILNDTTVDDLGTLTLRNVRTTGQVLLLADNRVGNGHVLVDGLTVDRANVRGRAERPHGFGVEALQGAFTLWNRQAYPGVVITAELLDLRGLGRASGAGKRRVRGWPQRLGGQRGWWHGTRLHAAHRGDPRRRAQSAGHARPHQRRRVRHLRRRREERRQRRTGHHLRAERHGP
jgi:hypothetical protein